MHPSRGILSVFESLFPAMCAILLAHMAGLSPFSCHVVIPHGTHGWFKPLFLPCGDSAWHTWHG